MQNQHILWILLMANVTQFAGVNWKDDSPLQHHVAEQ